MSKKSMNWVMAAAAVSLAITGVARSVPQMPLGGPTVDSVGTIVHQYDGQDEDYWFIDLPDDGGVGADDESEGGSSGGGSGGGGDVKNVSSPSIVR